MIRMDKDKRTNQVMTWIPVRKKVKIAKQLVGDHQRRLEVRGDVMGQDRRTGDGQI